MLYYNKFTPYELKPVGKRKIYDNNIYSFDIETTSYIIHDNKVYNNLFYETLSDKEQHDCLKQSCMYIWMFSINDIVYFGRTWDEFREFLKILDDYCPHKKIVFVHNLAFEFQFLYSNFKQENVFARASHKVMKSEFSNFNIELRCSLFMSNCSLERLPKTFNLPIKKLVGNLDYNKLRHSKTLLSEKELAYCEHDCLVIYYYILMELKIYEQVNKIPVTSTGHVRRELFDITMKNYKYKRRVRKAINTDPHIYNLLVASFQGGYTHANWIYTDFLLANVDSYDETSAYPYVMVTHKFPSNEFKRCYIKSVNQMYKSFAYLLVVNFKNVKSKFYNNFISASKCMNLRGAKYDNGRVIEAESFTMVITDVDFYLYLDSYNFEYEIVESYYSKYDYLPIDFIKFILEKYVVKTEFKDVEGKEVEYNLEKQKFNALYGMSVTNMIKDEVIFDGSRWIEEELTNEEIINKLNQEKKKAFLSFAYGVWVTAWARNNLLRRVIDLDKWTVYCDTDSCKLIQGYDKKVFENYNKSVEKRIEEVAKKLNIPVENYKPKDIKGKEHLLGVFEFEKVKKHEDLNHTYEEFITQGAKKYAYKVGDEIHITVSGVPKSGATSLKTLSDFKDGLVFKYKDTNKNLSTYNDEQVPVLMTDYQGTEYLVTDKTGICLLPNTYTLGKSLDYATLISDFSSKRSVFKE